MKILTIDASTRSTGWCIGEDGSLETHGCITANSTNVIKRIIKMRNQLFQIIKNNKIDKIIMEEVLPEYNSHTNKILMWLQAAIIIAAYEIDSNIEYDFISANEWRAILKIKQGRGIKRQMLKPQDIQYVENKYHVSVNDDEADAICIFNAYWQKFDNKINWE